MNLSDSTPSTTATTSVAEPSVTASLPPFQFGSNAVPSSSSAPPTSTSRDDEPDAHVPAWRGAWARRQASNDVAEYKEERRQNRMKALPIPDMRYEEGVMLSIKPYLHCTTAPDDNFEEGELGLMGVDRIEWGMVLYTLVRDQLLSPVLQGAFWGGVGVVLSELWTWNQARLKEAALRRPAQGPTTATSLLARLGIKLP